MLVSSLKEFNKKTLELISKSLKYLNENDLENLEAKTYILDGENLVMHVQEYITGEEEKIRFENHDHHLDLHYIVSGEETICISRKIDKILEQDETTDIKFYNSNLEVYNRVHLQKGDFLLTGLKELHKPRCNYITNQKVKKIVFKILVSE